MTTIRALVLGVILFVLAVPGTAHAAYTSCRLTYAGTTWSFLYKQLNATGTIRCSNGERAEVVISYHGAGVSFGFTDMDGVGRFSEVRDLSETLGSYASMEGHAGFVRSAEGRVMTKGLVWLSQQATGRGFGLGFAFGGFSIRRR